LCQKKKTTSWASQYLVFTICKSKFKSNKLSVIYAHDNSEVSHWPSPMSKCLHLQENRHWNDLSLSLICCHNFPIFKVSHWPGHSHLSIGLQFTKGKRKLKWALCNVPSHLLDSQVSHWGGNSLTTISLQFTRRKTQVEIISSIRVQSM
jgi:hypothetical protein